MAPNETDFRQTARYRRQRWFGIKPCVKRALAQPIPHAVMRQGSLLLGDHIRRERLPAPAGMHQVTARMAGVEFVMLRPDRCIVAKELYWGHGRRPRPEDQLALDLFARLASDAGLVLDIGAYTGVFSLLAARVSDTAEVHAYEVVPEVADAARDNAAANGLTDRVTVHEVGLGRDGEQVRIASGSGGSALPDFYSTEHDFTDGVLVDIRSLDAVTKQIDAPPPAVLKIDVEGAEAAVLAGGRRFLETYRPDILCEVLATEADPEAIQAVLDPLGYRYLRVEAGELRELTAVVPSAEFRDWLFTTRSDDELADQGILLDHRAYRVVG